MRVYDCFLFYNELDALKIRLSELADYVDVFVLIEAPWTFVGNPAPLLYEDIPGYNIRHIVIEDLKFPEAKTKQVADAEYLAFFNEWDIKWKGATKGTEDADATDIILCSDADEITRPSKIREGPLNNSVMMQEWYYYWLNCKIGEPWPGTSRNQGTPLWDLKYVIDANRIPDAGWHFSAFGGTDMVINKLLTGSHGPKTAQYAHREHVERSITEGTDVLDGLLGRRSVTTGELDSNLPATIMSDPRQWRHMMHPDYRRTYDEEHGSEDERKRAADEGPQGSTEGLSRSEASDSNQGEG